MRGFKRGIGVSALAFTCVASTFAGTFVWVGGTGDFHVGANWVGGVVPPVGAEVLVDDGNGTVSDVNVNANTTIANASIDADDTLRIQNGRILFASGTINNAGVFRIDSTGGNTFLRPNNATLILTGGGTLEMADFNGSWMYKSGDDGAFINVDNTIIGAGNFGWTGAPTPITNQANGIVQATGTSIMSVHPGNESVTNRGVFRADGGTMRIHGTFDNSSGGLIEAADASTVELSSTTISGGTLDTSGTGEILTFATSTLDGATENVVNNGTVRIQNGRTLRINGTIVNNDTIRIDSTGGNTYLRPIDSPVTLTGGGTVEMADSVASWIYRDAVGGELINVDNTIVGAGNLGWSGAPTPITNQVNGTVIAMGTNPLSVHPGTATITNRGVFRADGGTMRIQSNFDNTNGGLIEARDGNTVELSAADIHGGTLTALGSGEFVTTTSSDLIATAETMVLNGTHRIMNGRILTGVGTIENNGTIIIDSTGGNTYFRPADGPLMLTGSGTIEMTDFAQTWIYRNAAGGELNNVDNTIRGAGNLGWSGAPTPMTNQAGGTVEADGTNALIVDTGSAEFTNMGLMTATPGSKLTIRRTVQNAGGVIRAPAGATVRLENSSVIVGGELGGSGMLETVPTPDLQGVTINPGDSPGILTIAGNMPTQDAACVTEIELGGFTPGTEHDQINVSGNARFGGTMRVRSVNGYVPAVGDSFRILNYAAHNPVAERYESFESIGFPGILTVRVDYEVDHANLVVVAIGDINCDGMITVSDIAPLVIALTDPDNYVALFPNCPILDADINGDGEITVADIGPFVALLTGG